MSKIGVNISIDVTKLNKARFHQGKKGTYCDLTVFIDLENTDQYDNNGSVTQSQTKEERDGGTTMPFIGNAKIFWKGEGRQQAQQQTKSNADPAGDDIPFNSYEREFF